MNANLTHSTETFLHSYIETALWSSCCDDGLPMDSIYSADDIHPDTLNAMLADCRAFMLDNMKDIETHSSDLSHCLEIAAHDFWLTRNGHGAGFWGGDWPKASGKRLTVASRAFSNVDLYIGDDGKIHQA
jgi:hypothetical protein